MQKLLKPVELVSYTKLQLLLQIQDKERNKGANDKYVTNNTLKHIQKEDNFSKYPINTIEVASSSKAPFSQSSGFSSFDQFSLKTQTMQQPMRIDQMITLSVYNSTSGTIKKMLHGPTLKIYCVKEVPLSNRESRRILKDWITVWQESCSSDCFLKVHETFWNSPEGCVSVV